MDTTLPPPPFTPTRPEDEPDRSRTGAIWVTGTGAFLLLAAAAVFVAVRWEHLGDQLKFAILGALTGTFLLAGRRVQRELPATGGVLFHLGALLIPLNVAAIAVHAELPGDHLLLLEGVTATIAWFALERVNPSAVLRWASGGAFVVAAAGAAGSVGIPTPLVLAAAAVVALAVGAPKPALGWAVLAGLAPVAVFAEGLLSDSETAAALGLAVRAPGVAWVISGGLAAFVIGREAWTRGEALLVVPAAVSLIIGTAATWSRLDPSMVRDLLGAAAVFLAVELAAGLVRRDPFWRQPMHVVATVAEVAAAAAIPIALGATAHWFIEDRFLDLRRLDLAAAAVLVAAAWLVGDLRRTEGEARHGTVGWTLALGSGWWPASVGVTVNLLMAVALGAGSALALGAAMVVTAAALVLTGRPGGHAGAVVLTVLAPLLASFDLVTSERAQRALIGWVGTGTADLVAVVAIAVLAVAGALVLACAAVVRAHLPDPGDNEPLARLVGAAALGPIATGAAVLVDRVGDLALLVGIGAAAWAVGLVLDAGEPAVTGGRGARHLGVVGRAGALAILAGAPAVGARATLLLASALTVAFLADALRRRSPEILLGVAVTLPVLVGAIGTDQGLRPPEIGVALMMLAVVAAGANLLLGDRWGWPLIGVLVSSGAAGFVLAALEPATGWIALLALAGIGLAYSTVHTSIVGAAISSTAAVVAIWGLLADGGIEAFDAYLAPVAVVLVVAGAGARRSNRVSSWVAYAPAILLLGGSGLYERVQGGSGVHALVAGAVAVTAVVAGGARRLAAPLLLGTGLLVALTAHESLSVTRQVPTWGWLALGGTALVAAGIVMERHDAGPMETGRRLVDVVGTRFH